MSSPQMTTMLGFFDAASAGIEAPIPKIARLTRSLVRNAFMILLRVNELLRCIDFLPIILHVDDGPAPGLGFVEALVELADVRIPVVGPFALGIRVMDIKTQPRAVGDASPLQHLQVAVRVAERGDGPTAD